MENQTKGKWNGLRAIIVARQSDDTKGTASTAAQLEHMLQDFKRVGLRHVDTVTLDGVVASAPARIDEILQAMFARKRLRNDFDVIAWQVEDRASRSGGTHGMWLEHEAQRRGLLVFFAGDEEVTRSFDPVIKAVKYEAAKESSVGNSRRSRQGQTNAKKTGFFRTSGPTSMGCYRLYLNAEHRPKYYLRNLPDGRQEQIDYKTREVIGAFGTIGKKSRHRFIKQRIEYSLLMPGDADIMRVVRIIFILRYRRGWRGCRIADFLNRNRIPSPKGKQWSQRQVTIIYDNEAYTGVTYNDRTFSGRFYKGDKVMGFVPIGRREIDLVLKKTFTPTIRPVGDWDRIDQPYMYDFLPRAVRDQAIIEQAATWAARADPTRPKKKRRVDYTGGYLFSDLLKAKQDGASLTGSTSGREGSPTPYYRHPRSRRGRRKGSIYNNMIRADLLHSAAIEALASVLSDTPDLRERLASIVVDLRNENASNDTDDTGLEKEAEELRQQISLTVRSLKGAALAAVGEELERMGKRLNAIESRLQKQQRAIPIDRRPVKSVIDDAIKLLKNESHRLLSLPPSPLRELISSFITSATVDMETKAVEFEVAVPSWMLVSQDSEAKTSKTAEKAVCSAHSSRSPTDSQTHHSLLTIGCEFHPLRGSKVIPPCYACRRKGIAA